MSNIELIQGDCLEKMKDIPDKSVDMILCDLPYEVLHKNNPHAQWDRKLPFDKLWNQYERVIKDNGAIVLFAQGMFTAMLMTSNPKLWRYNLIWDKINRPTGFLNANRCPLRIHEDICVFYKKQSTYNPQFSKGDKIHSRGKCGNFVGGSKNRCYGDYKQTEAVLTNEKYPNSIIKIGKEKNNHFHPTQKPVALLEYLINTYSNEGDTILDNTMGSGSTMVACLNTKRNGIGIELNDEYFQIATQRVEEAKKKLTQQQMKLF
jgi:DNA modification methylase